MEGRCKYPPFQRIYQTFIMIKMGQILPFTLEQMDRVDFRYMHFVSFFMTNEEFERQTEATLMKQKMDVLRK